MKIAILNDTHAGIRNSSEIFINYQERFYDEVFFPYLLENDIKQILHLGDYYDNRKFINFKALNRNRHHFLSKLREYGISMDIIPGNHDTFYKNTNDLNSLKELLGHYMNEVHIVMEPKVVTYDDLDVALIPWICAENYQKTMNFIKECKAPVCGAHLELAGFEVARGQACHDGMDHKIFNKFELVLSGHFHCASQRDNIRYLGSQMEFFWSDADDQKYFHVLDSSTREVTAVKNPLRLFERIKYDDTKNEYFDYDVTRLKNKFVKVVVANKTDPFTFDRLIDRIQNEDVHELKIQENFSEFIGENVVDENISLEDTATLLDTYVEAVDTELDKKKIKSQMRELMREAQALEIS